jgi:hypothetical protein
MFKSKKTKQKEMIQKSGMVIGIIVLNAVIMKTIDLMVDGFIAQKAKDRECEES